ncbi:preprotein translocase subunit SecA [Candidatus Peregrinibacteria bacterium CG_4_10_14_0_2_um_filter_43_11]|nr:MAG: preprotein translocase subunit SecA [Candidatus Peregrinibacteria bacterium CG_4_10_14_0_2_um_filter_43_11]
MLTAIINKIIGDANEKELKKKRVRVEEINKKEIEFQSLSEEALKKKTDEFRKRFQNGESLDDLLVEGFAVVKNACRRLMGKKYDLGKEEKTWEMIPFDCQLIGAITLHEGKIAEMKTGEGKTLVAAITLYLNALSGKGVHLVTVNDYLAGRDAEWMGVLYEYLGLKTGVVVHGISPEDRKEAYLADITYGTNNEFGFDYLRDNMTTSLESRVQRGLNFAIVDEVDSILIDEARTPLIISAAAEESTKKYIEYAHLINQLVAETDYVIDEKARAATLTEKGIAKMEQLLGVENIYTESGFMEVHHIEQALKAKSIFKLDIDYVIKEGEILIVDEFTGRLMPGRRYSDGLHQAIEAKENVEVKRESRTLATITFQNYFRLYKKLSGMTGTAKTEEEEFYKIYGLVTIVMPTNKPISRNDMADLIFKSERGKFMAITEAIKEYYRKGQPVLVGTISVERSEMLSKMLKKVGIEHEVLNAKHHEREAEIISRAGQKGAVTIATNMAGRGTDIKLGEGVKELGGLVILGSERHESRRIDNQLRGRAGRQGDPGISRFYVSMDDSLMRLFGSDRIKGMMEKLGLPDDMPIKNPLISRSIEQAQKRVEGHNFDIRKHILEYDDVMNKHREIIYKRRLRVLEAEEIKEEITEMMKSEAKQLVLLHTAGQNASEWGFEAIADGISALLPHHSQKLTVQDIEQLDTAEEIIEMVGNLLYSEYQAKESALPDPLVLRDVEKRVLLHVIDTLWMEHIDQMTQLRESVALRGYGQRDPLIEYKQEAFVTLKKLLASIQHNVINTLFKVQINIEMPAQQFAGGNEMNMAQMRTNRDAIENSATESTLIKRKSVEEAVAGRVIGGTTIHNETKVGRNDDCSCGSGKKYKKCCGK